MRLITTNFGQIHCKKSAFILVVLLFFRVQLEKCCMWKAVLAIWKQIAKSVNFCYRSKYFILLIRKRVNGDSLDVSSAYICIRFMVLVAGGLQVLPLWEEIRRCSCTRTNGHTWMEPAACGRPMLEQFVSEEWTPLYKLMLNQISKKCRPWERSTLQQFVKDFRAVEETPCSRRGVWGGKSTRGKLL